MGPSATNQDLSLELITIHALSHWFTSLDFSIPYFNTSIVKSLFGTRKTHVSPQKNELSKGFSGLVLQIEELQRWDHEISTKLSSG